MRAVTIASRYSSAHSIIVLHGLKTAVARCEGLRVYSSQLVSGNPKCKLQNGITFRPYARLQHARSELPSGQTSSPIPEGKRAPERRTLREGYKSSRRVWRRQPGSAIRRVDWKQDKDEEWEPRDSQPQRRKRYGEMVEALKADAAVK